MIVVLVEQVMTRRVLTIAPDATAAAARRLLDDQRIRHLPVVVGGLVTGMLSDRDLRSASRGDPDRVRVSEIMTRDLVTVSPATRVEEAAGVMLARRIGGLPVLDGHALVGIVTTTDLLRAFVDLVERATLDRIAVDYHVGGPDMAPHTPQTLGSLPGDPGRSSTPQTLGTIAAKPQPSSSSRGGAVDYPGAA